MTAGEKVVMLLRGAGVESASIQTIERVENGIVTLDDEMGQFYAVNGRAVEPSVIPGFSKRIVIVEQ